MLKITVEKVLPVAGSGTVHATPITGGSAKVQIQQIVPFGNVEANNEERTILVVESGGIYDAFVQANKDEVTKLTKEVREAHTHIHADKDQVRADRNVVDADKKTVRADRDIVAKDKGVVAADKKAVATDKAAVSSDKTTVIQKRNEAADFASQALSSKNAAATSATTSTTESNRSKTEADRSKREADRAKTIADGININGGTINGNLTVSGYIQEGGKKLSDKYTNKAYVDSQINALKGGADGAYDTLKELQDAIQNNEGGIGTITTALGTKFDKTGGNITGDVKASGRVESELIHTKGYLEVRPYNSAYGEVGDRCRIYYKKHNNGKPNDISRGLVISANDKDGTTHPMDLWLNGNRVYHGGNKPVWSDIGGNSVINITGTYNKLQRGYLCAHSDGTGLLPDAASTTGRSRLGSASWWWRESYVAKSFTQELNIGDTTANITIKKTGNKLQFLV